MFKSQNSSKLIILKQHKTCKLAIFYQTMIKSNLPKLSYSLVSNPLNRHLLVRILLVLRERERMFERKLPINSLELHMPVHPLICPSSVSLVYGET